MSHSPVPALWPPSPREPRPEIATGLQQVSPRLRAYWFPEMRAWWVLHYDPLRPAREVGRARCLRYLQMAREEDIHVSTGKRRLARLMADGWALLYAVSQPELTGSDVARVSMLWHATAETVRAQHALVQRETVGAPRREALRAKRRDYAENRGQYLEEKFGRGRIVMPPTIHTP